MRLLSFICALLLTASAWAQSDPFFPKPSYFIKHFTNVPTRVELQPPARLSDFAVGGKLELSLKNYLDLVMANNPDVAIQKVTVEFSRDAILRAFSIFDPIATASFNTTRRISPSGSLLNGVTASGNGVQIASLNNLTQPFVLGYQQTLQTGTQYNINFNDTKTSTNNAFSTFNPQLSAGLTFGITQPLLRGRGMAITRLPISIARSKLKATDYSLQDQVMQILATAENAYWDVVNARESLRVQEESLKLADAALKRAEKEIELGATSKLEIYQPQANRANAELGVTQAQYRLAQVEDALRRQIGADLDPNYRTMPLVLTETLAMPPETRPIDKQNAVQEALRRRPDLKSATQNLDVDDLGIKQANNALLPNLSFTAQYGSSGLGGIYYPRTNLLNPGAPVIPIPGGLADALNGVFGFGYPVYGFGLTLTLPIRDRKAAADLADAMVQKRLDALKVRQVEENVRLQVLNAISQVENSRESVRIAKEARDLAQKRVEADQQRYELGVITLFFVLDSQNAFTQAEANLVNQTINYRRNVLSLLQRTGQLLEERGIVLQ